LAILERQAKLGKNPNYNTAGVICSSCFVWQFAFSRTVFTKDFIENQSAEVVGADAHRQLG
jgi:hypothetical protein